MPRRSYLLLVVAVVAAAFFLLRHEKAGDVKVAKSGRGASEARASEIAGGVRQAAAETGDGVSRRAATTRALFAYVAPANAEELTTALPAPSQKVHYVRLDRAWLEGKASPFWQKRGEGMLDLPLPDGSSLRVAIDGSEMLGAQRFTSTGRIPGRPLSRAVFAYNEGFLHATVEDPLLGTFSLRAATEELAQFYRVDPALVGPCGGERKPGREVQPKAAAGNRSAASPGSVGKHGNDSVFTAGATSAAAGTGQHAEVHVMMLYTQMVLPTLSGAAREAALQSAFDAQIAKANAAFEASLITVRLKLVKILETRYDETRSAINRIQDEALTHLYRTDDGEMDEIHAVRDAVGADVVCLALARRDVASSGLSFLLDTPNDFDNPAFAFSVVEYGNLGGTNVFPHEVGHVFGCAHDRENALSGAGAYSFSFGYRFFGADGVRYHDIMSYPPGIELSYFSNPNVILPPPISVAIGVAAGRPGESDSARTIELNGFATATFRQQRQTLASAGRLVNVATRAFVGTGAQVLIGGFVVEGTQAKRLLVRAAGPALASFGVAGALSDPVLRIFSRGAVVAENDNWSVAQPGAANGGATLGSAAEVSTAAGQVGAFGFAAGSRDAAVLVTLAPGAYSAVVEGAGGTTGHGLVEAYEVERNANRIINLATRGYADNQGKEMHGGFVVDAAPGETKRILVRVLGPTLERDFGMTDILFDPFLELRGAGGVLLHQNDDWSSGSQVVASTFDDFLPFIESYNERAIAATGFAPKNRREPCVMMDLPAGNYTVTVKPFELLSEDPDRHQPARPGVGILEVYEIR